MEMHPYFTEIPQRSFDAIVRNGWITEVMLALIVEPEDPYEIADTLVRGRGENLVIFPETSDPPYPAPIETFEFAVLGALAQEKMRITASQWSMTQNDARLAMRSIAEWDQRFGVWCACTVARTALQFIPTSELRPLRAIETAEAWVAGKATIKQVRDSAAPVATIVLAAARAAYEAANAAIAYNAVAAYAATAASVARVAEYASAAGEDTTSGRRAKLIRLREAVANACMTFPG